MNFSHHTFFAPLSTVPAMYTERNRCQKIRRLMETITPEHLALSKRDELLAIIRRLQDMADGEATAVCFFDDVKRERSPDIKPEDLHGSAEVFCGEEFLALFNGVDDGTSWFRVVNIGYPLLTNGDYIQKFVIRIPIYVTTDGIEAMAEIVFLPCKNPGQSLLEFNTGNQFIDVLEDFSNESVGDIDLQRKSVWYMFQHIDGSWFSIESIEPRRFDAPNGRTHDSRACIFSTTYLPDDAWTVVSKL